MTHIFQDTFNGVAQTGTLWTTVYPAKEQLEGKRKKSFFYQKILLNKYFSIMEIGGQPITNN